MADDDLELLTSPIEGRMLSRLFIVGGPVGLALAIMLGLWVAQHYVTHAVIVQVEPRWVAGETLALRVQVVPEASQPLGDAIVEIAVEQDGQRHPLAAPGSVELGGMAQGRFSVPSLTPGPATLHVHVEVSPFESRDERIAVEIVAERSPAAGRHMVSSSMSQYADDSDPQPDALKIDLRPRGRVLAGFDNELWLRVTDAKGQPWSGPAAMHLVDGELGDARGDARGDPPLLWEGRTDQAGLASMHGVLSSEVLRVRVGLLSEDESPRVLHERTIRLVSFAGAVHAKVEPSVVLPGEAVEVLALGLSAKRPVFVDVFGADGAWIDTFDPPMRGAEPRPWTPPGSGPSLVQLEAYHFTNAPGESTAVARVLVDPHASTDPASLAPLIARQRQALELPRLDRTWDETRERAYLDALAGRALLPAASRSARRWLLGTLPLQVHGPPMLLHTRERDLQDLLAYKKNWALGLRIFLFVGGGLFLLAMTVLMARSHARDADATLRELEELNEGEERELVVLQVRQARRAAFLRGLVMIAMMAGGVAFAMVVLESFVWEF